MLKESLAALLALLRVGGGVLTKLSQHTKEVDRRRYCKCCGGVATYYVTTAFTGTTREELAVPFHEVFVGKKDGEPKSPSLLLEHNPSFFLCNEHHPLIGKKRVETVGLLTHPKLEFHLITPNPYK